MNKINIFYLFFLIMFDANSMPEPFASINPLPSDLYGGACPTNQVFLTDFINKLQPMVIVEIGVWLGVNTFSMITQAPKNAKIYAIDPWLPWEDCNVVPYYNTKIDFVYHSFLSNCIHLNLTEQVVPIRMTSILAAKALNITPDLIYIDGSHTEENVYNDIMIWYPKVKKGGICCGDDWTWPSVKKGVAKAAKELGINFYHDNYNFWYFNPKG